MLSILAKTLKTASRTDDWDAPAHWRHTGRAMSDRQARQIEAQRRLLQMRDVGRW